MRGSEVRWTLPSLDHLPDARRRVRPGQRQQLLCETERGIAQHPRGIAHVLNICGLVVLNVVAVVGNRTRGGSEIKYPAARVRSLEKSFASPRRLAGDADVSTSSAFLILVLAAARAQARAFQLLFRSAAVPIPSAACPSRRGIPQYGSDWSRRLSSTALTARSSELRDARAQKRAQLLVGLGWPE